MLEIAQTSRLLTVDNASVRRDELTKQLNVLVVELDVILAENALMRLRFEWISVEFDRLGAICFLVCVRTRRFGFRWFRQC